jgi:UDP-N-acetylmuramoyl-tripeptide--D-alanyl-D-alanine ligase
MRLGEIIKVLGSSAVESTAVEMSEAEPVGYSIDSRTIRPRELFFAIKGENYDGHSFVGDALARGATAAVVSREFATAESSAGGLMTASSIRHKLIPVADTLAALQSLASSVLKAWGGRETAVTGSMGKTTTKEMTAAVLERAGRVMKTTGNLNNYYGLPLSILKMESDGNHAYDFDFAVLEMGMNHKGELTELTRIAPPDLGIVTNVAPVHLEFFDSVDAIADAKAELVLGVKPGGAAVLNADDERVARMREIRNDIDLRTFGLERRADVMARDITSGGLGGTRFTLVSPRGEIEAHLPLAGRHNLYNALAAAAAADCYGVPLERIAEGLGKFSGAKMRGEVLRFKQGFTLVDDSYNSNPRALVEMVRTMCATQSCRRRIVVAGEMLELGEAGPKLHKEAGRQIAGLGVDLLVGVRGLAREIVAGAREAGMSHEKAIFRDTPDEAAEVVLAQLREGDLVLVKGSRGVKTEAVVEKVKQGFEVSDRNPQA